MVPLQPEQSDRRQECEVYVHRFELTLARNELLYYSSEIQQVVAWKSSLSFPLPPLRQIFLETTFPIMQFLTTWPILSIRVCSSHYRTFICSLGGSDQYPFSETDVNSSRTLRYQRRNSMQKPYCFPVRPTWQAQESLFVRISSTALSVIPKEKQ